MNYTQIKIFTEGDKRFAQPVCPFKKPKESDYYKRHSEGLSWGDFLTKQRRDFTLANPPVVYIGTKPNGTYPAELFELVWQAHDPGTDWVIIPCYSEGYYNTRQALTDKADVKEVETEYPHISKLSADYKRSENLKIEVDQFFECADGGYTNVEHAFRCGAEFGSNWQQSQQLTQQLAMQKEQSETEIKDLKAIVDKYEAALIEIYCNCEHRSQYEFQVIKCIATNALNSK